MNPRIQAYFQDRISLNQEQAPPISGVFVYRHLGLVGCNIAIMKRFLPLLMLTGLLFGQDTTLVLKNGKILKGKIVSETDSYYTIIVKSSNGGLINFDLPIGIRKDIYKIETVDKLEAIAILNHNRAIIETENKRRSVYFACYVIALGILILDLTDGPPPGM